MKGTRASDITERLVPQEPVIATLDFETFFHAATQLRMPTIGIALVIALLVVSLGIHEAAHGWVALKRGDTTARDLGRITLNPIPHIDPMLTIVLPTMTYLSLGIFFGGAKPVPVNFHALRNPWRDMALVALAGPASNFLLAAFFLLCRRLVVEESGIWHAFALGDLVLLKAVFFNLLLAAFNLLPIPPLDGSRIMAWLLPNDLRAPYAVFERMGIGLLLVFLLMRFVPFVASLLIQTMGWMYSATSSIVSLGGLW